MRVYTGQTRSKRAITLCDRLGLGECVNRGELPPRRTGGTRDASPTATQRRVLASMQPGEIAEMIASVKAAQERDPVFRALLAAERSTTPAVAVR